MRPLLELQVQDISELAVWATRCTGDWLWFAHRMEQLTLTATRPIDERLLREVGRLAREELIGVPPGLEAHPTGYGAWNEPQAPLAERLEAAALSGHWRDGLSLLRELSATPATLACALRQHGSAWDLLERSAHASLVLAAAARAGHGEEACGTSVEWDAGGLNTLRVTPGLPVRAAAQSLAHYAQSLAAVLDARGGATAVSERTRAWLLRSVPLEPLSADAFGPDDDAAAARTDEPIRPRAQALGAPVLDVEDALDRYALAQRRPQPSNELLLLRDWAASSTPALAELARRVDASIGPAGAPGHDRDHLESALAWAQLLADAEDLRLGSAGSSAGSSAREACTVLRAALGALDDADAPASRATAPHHHAPPAAVGDTSWEDAAELARALSEEAQGEAAESEAAHDAQATAERFEALTGALMTWTLEQRGTLATYLSLSGAALRAAARAGEAELVLGQAVLTIRAAMAHGLTLTAARSALRLSDELGAAAELGPRDGTLPLLRCLGDVIDAVRAVDDPPRELLAELLLLRARRLAELDGLEKAADDCLAAVDCARSAGGRTGTPDSVEAQAMALSASLAERLGDAHRASERHAEASALVTVTDADALTWRTEQLTSAAAALYAPLAETPGDLERGEELLARARSCLDALARLDAGGDERLEGRDVPNLRGAVHRTHAFLLFQAHHLREAVTQAERASHWYALAAARTAAVDALALCAILWAQVSLDTDDEAQAEEAHDAGLATLYRATLAIREAEAQGEDVQRCRGMLEQAEDVLGVAFTQDAGAAEPAEGGQAEAPTPASVAVASALQALYADADDAELTLAHAASLEDVVTIASQDPDVDTALVLVAHLALVDARLRVGQAHLAHRELRAVMQRIDEDRELLHAPYVIEALTSNDDWVLDSAARCPEPILVELEATRTWLARARDIIGTPSERTGAWRGTLALTRGRPEEALREWRGGAPPGPGPAGGAHGVDGAMLARDWEGVLRACEVRGDGGIRAAHRMARAIALHRLDLRAEAADAYRDALVSLSSPEEAREALAHELRFLALSGRWAGAPEALEHRAPRGRAIDSAWRLLDDALAIRTLALRAEADGAGAEPVGTPLAWDNPWGTSISFEPATRWRDLGEAMRAHGLDLAAAFDRRNGDARLSAWVRSLLDDGPR